MRELSFFEQVQHIETEWRGSSINLPVFYYDVTTIIAGFITPVDRVLNVLPSPRMKPLRATPWHAVTTITCFEYRDSDIGPYNEVAISFPITIDKPAPVLTGLLRNIKEGPMAYVHHLPVTTEPAYHSGVDLYNYPKFIARIDFKREGDLVTCRLDEDDHHILTLSVREIPVKPLERWRFHGITIRDRRILRSEIIVNVGEQGISRNPNNAKLELGAHPIAEELRNLNLGRMIHLQYIPHNQAILTPVLESYSDQLT